MHRSKYYMSTTASHSDEQQLTHQFPDYLTWELFQQFTLESIDNDVKRCTLYHSPRNSPDLSSLPRIDIRELEMNSIFLWWLSSTAFISFNLLMFTPCTNYCVYHVNLYLGNECFNVLLHLLTSTVYESEANLTMAFSFVQHLLSPLPVDYVSHIEVFIRDDAPMLTYKQLDILSSIMYRDTSSPAVQPQQQLRCRQWRNMVTLKLSLHSRESPNTLERIVDSGTHPLVQLNIKEMFIPDYELNKLEKANTLLRECRTIPHLFFPDCLRIYECQAASCTSNPNFRSLVISVANYKPVPCAFGRE
jgi:hypothetical protein